MHNSRENEQGNKGLRLLNANELRSILKSVTAGDSNQRSESGTKNAWSTF